MSIGLTGNTAVGQGDGFVGQDFSLTIAFTAKASGSGFVVHEQQNLFRIAQGCNSSAEDGVPKPRVSEDVSIGS